MPFFERVRASATRYTQKARRAQTQSQTLLSRCQERLLIYLTELAGMQHVPTALSPQPHHAHPHVGRTRHIPVHRARERAPPPREIPTHGPTKENPLSLLRRTGDRTCDKATRLYCGPRARNMYTYTRVWTRANGLRSAAFGNGILRHAYAHAHAKPAAACATALYIQRARGTNDQSAADAAWLASARSSSV